VLRNLASDSKFNGKLRDEITDGALWRRPACCKTATLGWHSLGESSAPKRFSSYALLLRLASWSPLLVLPTCVRFSPTYWVTRACNLRCCAAVVRVTPRWPVRACVRVCAGLGKVNQTGTPRLIVLLCLKYLTRRPREDMDTAGSDSQEQVGEWVAARVVVCVLSDYCVRPFLLLTCAPPARIVFRHYRTQARVVHNSRVAELLASVCTLLTHIAFNASAERKLDIAKYAVAPLLLLLVRAGWVAIAILAR
jgi:hypothetical protein